MIRLKKMLIPPVVFLALGMITLLHAQERMRTGIWENTVTSSGRTAVQSHCIKPEIVEISNGPAAEVRAATEKALAKSGTCTVKEFKLEGDTLAQTVICGSSTLQQTTKFHGGDSFETTSTYTDAGVTHETQIKGRRTGDCKAGDEE